MYSSMFDIHMGVHVSACCSEKYNKGLNNTPSALNSFSIISFVMVCTWFQCQCQIEVSLQGFTMTNHCFQCPIVSMVSFGYHSSGLDLGMFRNCKFAPSDVLVRFAHLCNFENQTLGWDQDEGLPWQPAHAGPTLPYDIGFSDPAASGSADPEGGDDTAVDPGVKEEEAVLSEDEVLPMPDRPCPAPEQATEPTDQDHIHCDWKVIRPWVHHLSNTQYPRDYIHTSSPDIQNIFISYTFHVHVNNNQCACHVHLLLNICKTYEWYIQSIYNAFGRYTQHPFTIYTSSTHNLHHVQLMHTRCATNLQSIYPIYSPCLIDLQSSIFHPSTNHHSSTTHLQPLYPIYTIYHRRGNSNTANTCIFRTRIIEHST